MTLTNVTTSGTITSPYTAGGLVADLETDAPGGNITINGSSSNVTIQTDNSAPGSDWGGLVGYLYAYRANITIENSIATVAINQNDSSQSFGGIVGYTDTYDGSTVTLQGLTINGSINGNEHVGGVIGTAAEEWDQD